MKTTVNVIALILLHTTLFGQIDSTRISFVSYWNIGDSYDFQVTKINRKWKNGEMTQDKKNTYKANFTVVDSTEKSYTVKWSYESNLSSNYKIPIELVNRFSKYEKIDVLYKTTEVGDILEVINWKDIGNKMKSFFSDLDAMLTEVETSKAKKMQMIMKPLVKVYSSKEGVESIVLKELQYFHFPMGLEFDVNEELVYEDQLPNLFGGKPIKANAKLYFENVDYEKEFCQFKHQRKLDSKSTSDLLRTVLGKMGMKDKNFKKAFNEAVLEINDDDSFDYYYYPGIPKKIVTNRESTFNITGVEGRGLEKIIIEMIRK